MAGKNIKQVYDISPIVTNIGTDLMYFGRSPYGLTDDKAMLYSSFAAQFAGNVLTTKGDLYTFSTVNARLGVGSNGQILTANSAAATGLSWTTATFPSVGGAAGNILISNGTNYIASTSLWPNTVGTSGKIVISNGTSNVYSTPTYPNAATSTGSFLYADGTNWVASTSLWVNTVGSTGQLIQSNGTLNTYTTATYPSTATSAGTILRADGTNWAVSQATYPDLVAANAILFGAAANTVGPITPANSATLVSDGSGVPAWQALTAGQILIGTTASAPAAATIGSGTGITVTSSSGAISVAAAAGSGISAWVAAPSTPVSAAVDTGYYITNASQTTINIPATVAAGSVIAVVGNGAAGWILQANTGQVINFGNSPTSSAGTLTSTNQYDSVEILCVVANTTFVVRSAIGNITVA